MIQRILPIIMLLALVSGFEFVQAWQKDYKDQLPFIPQSPATSGKIITGMIASESANSR
jgi:hypothetical protein